jgi:hypothetical protein
MCHSRLCEELCTVHFVTAPGSAASTGHRAKSNVYVMPSGRLVVTRDNAKSIRSMRAMVITPWYTAPGVSGAPAAGGGSVGRTVASEVLDAMYNPG